MKKYIKHLSLLASILFTLSFAVNAQPGFDDDVEDTPIDGGIALLIGAGALLGGKKIWNLNQKQNQNDIEN
ncbi:MAG: hypothetical protein VKL60_17675 [Sphaerospermopsis sp.]|nr:hypothetical protein [Sphaerospermopsis sp.]